MFTLGLALLLFVSPMVVSGDNWAVLIAGSNYFFNYRHQSDICHAYQILTKKGSIPAQNIIVMMYDDIAHNSENPFPGQIFNHPNGTNVYAGVVIDYSGDAVNKTTFLKVLKGDKSAGGKVLQSTANDDVFIYYADHGAVGLVAMPTGDVLYANELMDALTYMHTNNMYHQVVFYLEACESGSMFDTILPANMSIFATTAANPDESSYAFYFWDPVGTYLGDEYSVRWMEDSDAKWVSGESLIQQFTTVKGLVKLSHPQKYGCTNFDKEPISDFQGDNKPAAEAATQEEGHLLQENGVDGADADAYLLESQGTSSTGAVDSRDVKLVYLLNKYNKANSAVEKQYFKLQLDQEISFRTQTATEFENLMLRATGANTNDISKLMKEYRAPKHFNCLKSAVSLYEKRCGKFEDYSLKFVKNLVFLCEEFSVQEVMAGVSKMCS
jgi:legumain